MIKRVAAVRARLSVLVTIVVLAACGSEAPPPAQSDPAPTADATLARTAQPAPTPAAPQAPAGPHAAFWKRLRALCGNAYAGYLTVGTEESDRQFGEADLKMQVLHCADDEIQIPFHVSEDRSRTFMIRRVPDGLTLHHRHRHEDGTAADPDGYGGRTVEQGSASRQAFVVDDATRAALPETRYNVWAIEVDPGNYLAYELKRVEEDRYFRVEFDLAATIDPPPPPWGD